jgi:hypothetical protein
MVYERAASDRTAAPTEMMPRLAEISGMVVRHARQMVQQRDHFEIRTMSAFRAKAERTGKL